MKRIFLLILLYFISLFCCKKTQTEPEPLGRIKGSIIIEAFESKLGIGAQNEPILLDSLENIHIGLIMDEKPIKESITTNGIYTFSNIEEGKYSIYVVVTEDEIITLNNLIDLKKDQRLNVETFTLDFSGTTDNGNKYAILYFENPLTSSDFTFSYSKDNDSDTDWELYNINGELVNTVTGTYTGDMSGFTHRITWKLIDENNNVCPGGIYFILTRDTGVGELFFY